MDSRLERFKFGGAEVSYYGLDERFTIEQFKNTSIGAIISGILKKSDIISSELSLYGVLDSVPEKSDGISSKFYPNREEEFYTVFCDAIDTYENGIVINLKYPKGLRDISGYDCTYSSASLIIGPEGISFVITDFGIRDLPDYWKDKKIYDVFGNEIDNSNKKKLDKVLEKNKNVVDHELKKLGKKFDTEIFYEELRYWDYPNPDATEKEWIEYSMIDRFIHKRKEKKQQGKILDARKAILDDLITKILTENINQTIVDTEEKDRIR